MTNPTVSPRYIFIYHVNSGSLIQRVDSFDKSLVTIGSDSRTVSFQLNSSQPNTYQSGEEYEIIFEEGVVVGTSASCSGGGPVSNGISFSEWTFFSNGPTGCTDECFPGRSRCHDKAQCSDHPGGFRCDCAVGYSGDGVNNCDDIDECALDTNGCDRRSTCFNTPGSFYCTCNAGYEPDSSAATPANRPSCIDINECARGTAICDANEDCINAVGSVECVCKTNSVCRKTELGFNCSCKIEELPEAQMFCSSAVAFAALFGTTLIAFASLLAAYIRLRRILNRNSLAGNDINSAEILKKSAPNENVIPHPMVESSAYEAISPRRGMRKSVIELLSF